MPKLDTKAEAGDFKNLIDLMAVHAEASARMAELTNTVNTGLIDLADEHKDEYARIQTALTEAETSLEVIARQHAEWFADSKTVKTPYGSVSFRATTKLEVPNEELTIALLEQRIAAEDRGAAEPQSERLLRRLTVLNLEALEQLSDEELKALRVRRVANESFAVKPLKVDLGKAVKAAADRKAVAA